CNAKRRRAHARRSPSAAPCAPTAPRRKSPWQALPPPAPRPPLLPRRTSAGTARADRRRDRRAEARPRFPCSELCPQLGGAQDLGAELGVGRHELPDDAEHDLRLVAERAEDPVALEKCLSARAGVHREVAVRVAPLAEEGVRLLDRVAHGTVSSGRDPSRAG